ncbi:MAG TPA: 8-amino-7-oxononanoate synthase, partial [Longimicrobiales bacterium]|nr:8-amino-7-oxononanoate synthase [Longimicrobiales bacterium]
MHRAAPARAAAPTLEDDLAAALGDLERAGLLRRERRFRRVAPGLVADGARAFVDFASNDYLGLADDVRLAEAAARALATEGTGAGAARLITGTHPLHEELERELAALVDAPAALLFASGYAANTGALPALARAGDTIYSDALNHASLIDACRLSRARVRVFPHADVAALEGLLASDARAGAGGRRWIVVEGVYSMEGDAYPLEHLLEVAHRHGARTYLDDAHGVGVLGATGGGSAEQAGLAGRFDVLVGTLGKAFGAAGAFVAGTEALRRWLLNRARTFVFSTAPPPALAAAALEALRIARAEPERRARLRENAARMRAGLGALGHALPANVPGHIVPVRVGSAEAAVAAGRALAERGYVVGSIRPPSVPEGGARLRLTLSAAHTPEQIDGLLDAL